MGGEAKLEVTLLGLWCVWCLRVRVYVFLRSAYAPWSQVPADDLAWLPVVGLMSETYMEHICVFVFYTKNGDNLTIYLNARRKSQATPTIASRSCRQEMYVWKDVGKCQGSLLGWGTFHSFRVLLLLVFIYFVIFPL